MLTHGPNDPWELALVETSTLEVLRREKAVDIAARSQVGKVTVWDGLGLTFGPQGAFLIVSGGREGVEGLLTLDGRTWVPTHFFGPMEGWSDVVVAVAPGEVYANGAVLVAGTRGDARLNPHWVFVLDGETLALADSFTVPAPDADPPPWITQILPAGDSRHLFVAGYRIYKYDLVARRVVADARRSTPDRLWLSSDGQTLYLNDDGSRDFPGYGLLFRYSADDLTEFDSFDLRGMIPEGRPNTEAVAESHDGSMLYVLTGTPSKGLAYGPRPSRILVLDAETGAFQHLIELDDYGVNRLFVF